MNAVGMCALLGVIGVGSTASTPETAMALTLLIPDSASAPGLEAFLRERAVETWNVGETEPRFEVAVDSPAERLLVVRVREAGRELARREIEVLDPGATKLTVWLVVKSTINRALRDTVEEQPVAIEPPEPVEPVTIEPTEVAAPAEEPRQTWAIGALLTGVASSIDSIGASVVAWLSPSERLEITLEVGYRISPGIADFTIHYVPMTASFGWQVSSHWTAGAFATADLKIPTAESGSKLAAGLDLGGFIQARIGMTEHSHLLGRLFIAARASRMRFLLDSGSVTEGPVLGGLAVGALWP